MTDIGKISDGDLSNPKKSLNRKKYYIDHESQKILDSAMEKHKPFNESEHEEILKKYIWNKISDNIREKQTLFYEAKTNFEQQKATSDLLEKQQKVKSTEEHVKLKANEKDNKKEAIEKKERLFDEVLKTARKMEGKIASYFQNDMQTCFEEDKDRLLAQNRCIESLQSEINENRIKITKIENSKEKLLVDINLLNQKLAAKENEHKQLEEKCVQLEKGYRDINKEYKEIETKNQFLNQKIAHEEESQRDLEKQLAPIHVQLQELQLKLDHSKEMQVSEVLGEETSDSLKKKIAEKEKHLVELQKEVEAHERDVADKEEQKRNLEYKMLILHEKIEEKDLSEEIACMLVDHQQLLFQFEDTLDKIASDIKLKDKQNFSLEEKKRDLKLLKSAYLREEINDEQEYENKRSVLEAKSADIEKEIHLAKHQEKIGNTQESTSNLSESKQDLVNKDNNVEEAKQEIIHKEEYLEQLDLKLKIAYIEKEILYLKEEISENEIAIRDKEKLLVIRQKVIKKHKESKYLLEEQLKREGIKESYDIYEIVPSEVREQYNKMYANEKLEESLLMLSGLNANVKDSKDKCESQKRAIQELERVIHNQSLIFDKNVCEREIKSFIKYYGLKDDPKEYKQFLDINLEYEIINDKNFKSGNAKKKEIEQEMSACLHNIALKRHNRGYLMDEIFISQAKMRNAQNEKTQIQGLLEKYANRVKGLEAEKVKRAQKDQEFAGKYGAYTLETREVDIEEKISKIGQMRAKAQESLHNEEKKLTAFSQQEASQWEKIYKNAEETLPLLYKEIKYRSEYLSINNKIQEYLSKKLEIAEKSYKSILNTSHIEKSKIEGRIKKAFANVKTHLDSSLQNLQQSLNEKKSQMDQISKELEILPEKFEKVKQNEVSEQKKLQEQFDHLTSQSSDLHRRITSISQALESHRQELEQSHAHLADASYKKMHLEKQAGQTRGELQKLHKQLEYADTQFQQKLKQHDDIRDRLTKAIEEQKKQEDRLVKAQAERQALEEKQNKGLEELKHEEKDLNNSISIRYKPIFQHHERKISSLGEELAKADKELVQAHQELEHAKAEEQVAWKKVNALLEQQKSPIEVQCLSTELQAARTKMRHAQIELQNAMSEASEEIILQFSSNDEVRVHLGEAKVEAMESREYIKPNYATTIGKHRDFASQYGLVMKGYKKELEKEKNQLLEVNDTIEHLGRLSKQEQWKIDFTENVLKEAEEEIDKKTKTYNLLRNEHDQLSRLYKAYEVISSRYPDIAKVYENINNEIVDAIEDNDIKHGSSKDQLRNLTSQSSSSHHEITPILQALESYQEEFTSLSRSLEAGIEQEKSFESKRNDTQKKLKKVKMELGAADDELLEKDKKIVEIKSKLKLHLLEKKRLEASLIEATKKREAIRAKRDKTNKAMNNLDKFLDYLRHQP